MREGRGGERDEHMLMFFLKDVLRYLQNFCLSFFGRMEKTRCFFFLCHIIRVLKKGSFVRNQSFLLFLSRAVKRTVMS